MVKTNYICVLICFFSLSATAEQFFLKVRQTEHFNYEVFLNEALIAQGGATNGVQEDPIGKDLLPGDNSIRICYTAVPGKSTPAAKDLTRITIQAEGQRSIASNVRLGKAQKYYVYSLAPFGDQYQTEKPVCEKFIMQVVEQQIAEFAPVQPAEETVDTPEDEPSKSLSA